MYSAVKVVYTIIYQAINESVFSVVSPIFR